MKYNKSLKHIQIWGITIPFASNSLDLVAQSAVDCCVKALSYLGFTTFVHILFGIKTSKEDLLIQLSKTHYLPSSKHQSDTRWSARADTTEAVFQWYQVNTCLIGGNYDR